MGTPDPGPSTGWFAGGGGGGADDGMTGGTGGAGGGANATTPGYENNGDPNTGGGGGGTIYDPAYGASSRGGNGGSGTVIVRYQHRHNHLSGPLGGAKATGGTFYTYGSKTVHVFTSSGDFTNISGAPLTVDHILVAGGGGGGSGGGAGSGGGGAGGVRSSISGLINY